MVNSLAPRVLIAVHDPVLRSQGGRTVREYLGWADPIQLAREYVEDVRQCSYGYVNYEVVDVVAVDGYPIALDGFRYSAESYLEARQTGRFHEPIQGDYLEVLREQDVIARVDAGEFDELWDFEAPGIGFWESTMAGPDAFWCNSPPLPGTQHCSRKFVIMTFSYERGVGEMLEDLGHRAESMLVEVFRGVRPKRNLFERFTRYDLTHPDRSEVGNVHFAPNSLRDYDWGNPRPVISRCDNWYRFPDLGGPPKTVTCADWGNGDTREHHRWWFRHFPHIEGETDGISRNWWNYVIDPNRVDG